MKEDTARDRKSSKAAMHFSLAQNNIKCLHSCSKVWFGLSTEVCAAMSTPAYFCAADSMSHNFHPCIFDCATDSCLAVSVDPALLTPSWYASQCLLDVLE